MWATLPLLCAGAWLLGVPVCGAAELSVNSLGTQRARRPRGC
ncbi:CTSH isoform 3 [Pan troglodytes]|uniref:CTSH isoform 3 n=1 Tax=Pan troglodytes TaxID=9598 RepID=A0A2J8KCF5_PANTR|nr:CTSH isoform 3 [Pan troglodytes]